MTHAELVQLGTNLLAESTHPEYWLPSYDQALGSVSDQLLVEFVNELFVNEGGRELHVSVKLAA